MRISINFYKEVLKGPKKLSTKNVLRIKANKSITFNTPFSLKTTIAEDCWYGYQVQLMKPERKYGVSFQYVEPNDYVKTVLPKSAQDSLKQMGYELYDKKIVSNKVSNNKLNPAPARILLCGINTGRQNESK
jgi:hypothetical protein